MRIQRAVLGILVLALPLGCREVVGLDELEFAGSGEGGGGGKEGQGPAGSGAVGSSSAQTSGSGGAAPDCPQDDGSIGECLPEAPAGWAAYRRIAKALYTGSSGAPPICPDGSTPETYFAGPAVSPSCTACSCTWDGAACTAPTLQCFASSKVCGNGADYTKTAKNENCLAVSILSGFGAETSCKISSPAVVSEAGVCKTSGAALQHPLPWDEEVFVCSASVSAGGCGVGQACTSKGGGSYAGSACIARPGSESCPPGWTDQELHVFSIATDTRTCSPCACKTDVSCSGGSYTVYEQENCAGVSVQVSSMNCVSLSNQLDTPSSIKPTLATVIPGTCEGGVPSGALQPAGEMTLCCKATL